MADVSENAEAWSQISITWITIKVWGSKGFPNHQLCFSFPLLPFYGKEKPNCNVLYYPQLTDHHLPRNMYAWPTVVVPLKHFWYKISLV